MKTWRLAVAVLLLGLMLWPALPAHADRPAQVWVDDNYCLTCANDGHAWREDAFATISDALEQVAPGGTVHVLPGRYQEDVRITVPCNLIGEGAAGALLEPVASDVTLTVAANSVTVRGLQIVGGERAAILVLGPDFQYEPIRDVTILDNVVQGGYLGIAVNVELPATMDVPWNYGQLSATGVRIRGNTVAGCTRAIYVYHAHAEIAANAISELNPSGIGIYSSQNSVSTIRANTVHVDVANGRAVYVLDNEGTLVEGNTLIGTSEVLTPTTAFALSGYHDLVLSDNTVQGFYWGTNTYTGGSARIVGNTFDQTMAWALNLGTTMTMTQVLVEGNLIRGSYWGLRLDDDGGYGLHADVLGNTFVDNGIGVQLAASLRQDQVRIHGNAICGNLVAGLRNESMATVDATENWWGANDGPRPTGSGDRVEGAGAVNVQPWMRITAGVDREPDGRVRITARLGGINYYLPERLLTFTTDRGTFMETGGKGRTTLTDSLGSAQATLTPLDGEWATVNISNSCGLGLAVMVR